MKLKLSLALAAAFCAGAANAASPACEAARQQYQELRSRSVMDEAQFVNSAEAATMRSLCGEAPIPAVAGSAGVGLQPVPTTPVPAANTTPLSPVATTPASPLGTAAASPVGTSAPSPLQSLQPPANTTLQPAANTTLQPPANTTLQPAAGSTVIAPSAPAAAPAAPAPPAATLRR